MGCEIDRSYICMQQTTNYTKFGTQSKREKHNVIERDGKRRKKISFAPHSNVTERGQSYREFSIGNSL